MAWFVSAIVVSAIALLLPEQECQAVIFSDARLYRGGSCTGSVVFQMPFEFGNVCQEFSGPANTVHSSKFDCATETRLSYNTSGCKPENVVSTNAECSIIPAANQAYDYGCNDYPADQFVVVEAGAGCNGGEIENRTRLMLLQLGCLGIDDKYQLVSLTGDLLRVANYNRAGCSPQDMVAEQVLVLGKCTTNLLPGQSNQPILIGKGLAAKRVTSGSTSGPSLSKLTLLVFVLLSLSGVS